MIKKYDSYSIYCMHDRALNSNSTRIYCTLSLLLCIIKRHLRLRYIKPALCVFADHRESRLGEFAATVFTSDFVMVKPKNSLYSL